jgi:hypothetical protein
LLFSYKALLKLNVVYIPMIIGANTRDSCLEKWVKGDPAQAQSTAEAPEPPAYSERLERNSTGKINRAYHKKGSNHKQAASFYHAGV